MVCDPKGMDNSLICGIVLVLLILKSMMELFLNRIDAKHIRDVSNEIPEVLKDFFDSEKYEKAREYALAKLKLGSKQEYYDLCSLY